MQTINKLVKCPYSALQMFDIVNNVQAYPEFIDWCYQVNIIEQNEELLKARLYLQKGILKHSFATQNILDKPHSMQMSLLEGPFKSFSAQWQFKQLTNESEISFTMKYEFSNALLKLSIGNIFHSMADNLVQDFLNRAKFLYPAL